MEPDILRLAQLFAVIGMFTAGMIGLAWVTKIAFSSKRPKSPPLAPGVDEARFSRLENAVETIAIEVERIAESQRFTAKLMAGRENERERQPASLPGPARDRPTTPLP